jgi:hypothetical protein
MPYASAPAPVPLPSVPNCGIDDLTLRDWFAGQVFAAMIGSDSALSAQRDDNGRPCGINPSRLSNMAKTAYQTADALMQAREQV